VKRSRIIATLFACLLCFSLGAEAAYAAKVVKINVEGARRIEPDAILNKISTSVGDEYSPTMLDSDLRAIFDMGFFYDVQIDSKEVFGGIELTLIVEEKPAVKEYEFVGNSEISDDKIKEATDLKPNTILSDSKIKESIFKITKLYENEGYFMVDIDYRLEDLPQNRVKVFIEINEYRKVYIKRINFMGNRAFADERLKKVLMTKEGDIWSFMSSSGIYRPELFLNDIQMLRAFYLDNGYIGIKVGEPTINLSADRRSMFISVDIEEGQQYYVGNVELQGDLLFSKDSLMQLIEAKKGDLFKRSAIEKSIYALRSKYTDIGFAFAEVTTATPTDQTRRVIDLIFKLQKGKLAYFEEIVFAGNENTRDKVIRRELSITEGDLYSGPGIRKSKERLMRLGYFDEVAISTEQGSRDDAVRLTIRVKERQQGQFMVGVGFSSLENFVGQAQVSHNNMLGYGVKVAFNADFSKIKKNYQLRIREPHLIDTDWIGSLSLMNSERSYYQFDRFTKSIQTGLGRPLHWDWEAHFAYSYSSVDIKNVERQAASFLTRQAGQTVTTSTKYTLSRETVNHPFDPTDGSRVSLMTEWAGEYFGGDLNFLKLLGQARKYQPIYKGLALMFNGEAGYGYPLDGNRLHITERFFLGGLNSVRGFPIYDLSPTESSMIPTNPDDPASTLTEVVSRIGGDKMLQGNIELLIPIVKDLKIKGVIFYDIGNTLLEDEWFAIDGLRQSWGFGVRWISPIGPLRFEWGYPLHPVEGERDQVFEFGIGTFF
jgi:outer membrane protein insertion porin family